MRNAVTFLLVKSPRRRSVSNTAATMSSTGVACFTALLSASASWYTLSERITGRRVPFVSRYSRLARMWAMRTSETVAGWALPRACGCPFSITLRSEMRSASSLTTGASTTFGPQAQRAVHASTARRRRAARIRGELRSPASFSGPASGRRGTPAEYPAVAARLLVLAAQLARHQVADREPRVLALMEHLEDGLGDRHVHAVLLGELEGG